MCMPVELIGRRVRVRGVHSNFDRVGRIEFVFPANIKPRGEDILKYYFDDDVNAMDCCREYKSIMGALPYDRVVVKGTNGTRTVTPYNEYFTFEVLGDSKEVGRVPLDEGIKRLSEVIYKGKCICGYDGEFETLHLGAPHGSIAVYRANREIGRLCMCPKCDTVKFIMTVKK